MMIHEFKTWMPYFQEVIKGNKTFEIRKDDRPLRPEVGDVLILTETFDGSKTATGNKTSVIVTYILDWTEYGSGIQPHYYIMSIKNQLDNWEDYVKPEQLFKIADSLPYQGDYEKYRQKNEGKTMYVNTIYPMQLSPLDSSLKPLEYEYCHAYDSICFLQQTHPNRFYLEPIADINRTY